MKKVLFAVVPFLLLASAAGCSRLQKYHSAVENMQIHNVDLSKVPDGTYTGSQDFGLVAADVRVTVKDGRIVSVELTRHLHGPNHGVPAEVLTNRIVEAQSVELDSVTGATGSSKAILKAVENALESAPLR